METTTALLIHQYLIYELEKVDCNPESNSMNQNLRAVGTNLGYKTMLKLSSNSPMSKTKDVNSSIKFFIETFWEFFFGKKIPMVQLSETNKAVFVDADFDLLSRTITKGSDPKAFQEHTKNFVRYIIEGAMSAISLKSNVEVQFNEGKTTFLIECTELTN